MICLNFCKIKIFSILYFDFQKTTLVKRETPKLLKKYDLKYSN